MASSRKAQTIESLSASREAESNARVSTAAASAGYGFEAYNHHCIDREDNT